MHSQKLPLKRRKILKRRTDFPQSESQQLDTLDQNCLSPATGKSENEIETPVCRGIVSLEATEEGAEQGMDEDDPAVHLCVSLEEEDQGEDSDYSNLAISDDVGEPADRMEEAKYLRRKRNFFQKYFTILCPFCGMKFTGWKIWNTHVNDVHEFNNREKFYTKYLTKSESDKVKCNSCDVVLKDKFKSWKTHVLGHLAYPSTFLCKICSTARRSTANIHQHIEKQHFDIVGESLMDFMKSYVFRNCVFCGHDSGATMSLAAHMKAKHSKMLHYKIMYMCPYCGEQFTAERPWKQHLNASHQFNTISGMSFELVNSLKEEQQESTDRNARYRCLTCNAFFSTKTQLCVLWFHALHHLPYKRFKCRYCDYVHTKRDYVIAHACRKLLAALKTLPELKSEARIYEQHDRTEDVGTDDMLHVCPACGESFERSESWLEHLKQAHNLDKIGFLNIKTVTTAAGSTKYCCSICEKLFVSAHITNMRRHSFSHMPYKIYKCKRCDKQHNENKTCSCNRKKDLAIKKPKIVKRKAQKYAKVGDILYVCPSCGDTFEGSAIWLQHLTKAHNFDKVEFLSVKTTKEADGTVKYNCAVCKKALNSDHIHNIQTHAIKHMPYEKYQCRHCNKYLNSKQKCSCRIPNRRIEQESIYLNSFVYVCPKCGSDFISQEQWEAHTACEHNLSEPSVLNFIKLEKTGNNGDDNVSVYRCTACNLHIKESKSSTQAMLMHASLEHLPFKCYKCIKCTEACATKDRMLAHVRACKTLKDLEFACSKVAKCECGLCGYASDEVTDIFKHLHNVHHRFINSMILKLTWLCIECQLKYQSEEEILQHMKQYHLSKIGRKNSKLVVLHCTTCNATFERSFRWRQHINTEHAGNTLKGVNIEDRGDKWKCLQCGVIFRKVSRRRNEQFKHFLTHSKPFKCSICGMKFSTNFLAMNHVAKCSGDANPQKMLRKAAAAIIGDDAIQEPHVFINESSETMQKSSNNTESEVADPLNFDLDTEPIGHQTTMATCSEKTTAFNQYVKIITYACPECNIPLETQEDWHKHISTMHHFFGESQMNMSELPGRKFKCNECGVVVSGSILHHQRHKLVHMPYQAFICSICRHRSKTQNVLIGHIRRKHFTPGSFKCIFCPIVLETFYERYVHTRAEHSDAEWPDNVCQTCVQPMANKESLSTHMKTHDFDRETHACEYCNRKFYNKCEVRKHVARIHPNEYVACHVPEQNVLFGNKEGNRKRKKTKSISNAKNKPHGREDCSDEDSSDFQNEEPKMHEIKTNEKVREKNSSISSQNNIYIHNLVLKKESSGVKDEPQSDNAELIV